MMPAPAGRKPAHVRCKENEPAIELIVNLSRKATILRIFDLRMPVEYSLISEVFKTQAKPL
jgi:hypothetical protein